jgi:hypothetical protein
VPENCNIEFGLWKPNTSSFRVGDQVGCTMYPCEHADLIDITSFCDSVFGQTGLVRSDKEVPWFSQRFSTLSPKGQLQPS